MRGTAPSVVHLHTAGADGEQRMLNLSNCPKYVLVRLAAKFEDQMSLHADEQNLFPSGRPGPPVPRILREGISESQAKSLVDSYLPMVNNGLGECSCRVASQLSMSDDRFVQL